VSKVVVISAAANQLLFCCDLKSFFSDFHV
jgi:hypothetical protein